MKYFIFKYLKKIIGKIIKFMPNIHRSIDGGVTVFAFHDVTNNPSEFVHRYGLGVSKENFQKQILWIKSNFQIVHPEMLLNAKNLPKRAAIISFDDGYLGTFINALPILEKLNVPCVIFINMKPILNSSPMISAVSCYLTEYDKNFIQFCKFSGLKQPYHLSLNPVVWHDYLNRNGKIENSILNNYQGELVDLATMRKWDGNNLVCYGNHLFEHWNSKALSAEEFKDFYLLNKAALNYFISNINLFAFTNGTPFTCFSQREINLLKTMKVDRIFSAVGGINKVKDNFLLGRIALSGSDVTDADLWFALWRGVLNDKMNRLID